MKDKRYPRRVRDLILLALTFFLASNFVQNVAGSVYLSLIMQPYTKVTSPPVFLQAGTAGSSTIYTSNTSAKVSTAAPAPTPTYYPNTYSVTTGTYVSGNVPSSVQTVDTNYFTVRSTGTATSTTAYNPSGYSLLGSTTLVSGTTSDLASNNGVYMTLRSYTSATTAQTLYAHQDQTIIGGTNYYLKKLSSADAAGTSLSASMASTGRQLMGKFVYQLTGVSSIPASTWTMYYRGWQYDSGIAFDAQSSMTQSTTATSISWSHTTGTGSNRLLLVAVGVHIASGTPATVSSVTYDGVALTEVTTALDSADTPQVRTYVFQLVNPTSGTKTIAVNFAAATLSVAGATTYANVDQTTPIQTSNTATGSGTSPSVSVTVTGSGRWLFGHLGAHRTSTWSITGEGTGQTNRWAKESELYKGRGSDKSVSAGSQSMSWTLQTGKVASYVASAVVINPAVSGVPVGHMDADILIRQSTGTIRTTIATNVANSGNLASSPTTLSGTYSWVAYTVVDQIDYLEMDYYAEVTTAASGAIAYLRIDDNTLAAADQTGAANVILPSEFTSEVEFTGTSNTQSWYQLVWTVDSAWTAASVTTTIQVYNYTLGGYPTSGNGYNSYTTSATANTDEAKTQSITTNPAQFRNATGYWKMKIKGVKITTTQFDFKADWIEFKPSRYTEYTASTEFLFSSMTKNTPTQLNFTVVSQYDIANVSVTIQVWNYSSSPPAYVTSGEGYISYTSSASPNTDETKFRLITTNPQFYTSNGNAKIKITGVLSTTTQYQQKVNEVKLVYSYSSSSNYNYVLKIVNNVSDPWKIRLRAYSDFNKGRLNCTIYFRNASDGTSGQVSIVNGVYTQQFGPWYDLPAKPAETYIVVTLQANNSEVSYVYVYLEILIPNKTTYAQYVITFEIT